MVVWSDKLIWEEARGWTAAFGRLTCEDMPLMIWYDLKKTWRAGGLDRSGLLVCFKFRDMTRSLWIAD